MWYVEYLLLNSPVIKEEHDFDSEVYNDLLVVERELHILAERKLLCEKDLDIVTTMVSKSYTERTCTGYTDPETVIKVFKRVCNLVSYSLGGVFTDEGYVDSLSKSNNLTEDQKILLLDFMKSQYRHFLLSKPFKGAVNEQ